MEVEIPGYDWTTNQPIQISGLFAAGLTHRIGYFSLCMEMMEECVSMATVLECAF